MVKNCETAVKARGNNITADCIANCLLNRNNLLNSDGSVKKDALTAFFIKQANDQVWNAGITKSVNTCVEDGKFYRNGLKIEFTELLISRTKTNCRFRRHRQEHTVPSSVPVYRRLWLHAVVQVLSRWSLVFEHYLCHSEELRHHLLLGVNFLLMFHLFSIGNK